MAAPTVLSINPVDGFNQWPVTETISILFDQEVDAYSAARAIFIHGPDTDVFVGPGMENLLSSGWNPTERALLSPGYSGDAFVDIEVIRADINGIPLDNQFTYEPSDVEYSLVRVTPKKALYELTSYKLFLAGDAVQNTMSVNSRSVFDAAADVANTGSGEIISSGVYNGSSTDTLVIEFTTSGNESEARYDWYLLSAPGSADTRRSFAGLQELLDDVFIEAFGEFNSGDIFTIRLVPAEQITATIVVNFTTGANHVTELPANVSESSIVAAPGIVSPIGFEVISIKPATGSSNVSLSTNQIVFTFSKAIDPLSVSHESIRLQLESVDGSDPVSVPYSFIVSGNKLYINLMEH